MKNFVDRTNELFELMRKDEFNALRYRNEIVELNLRLVAHVLKKYRPYTDDQYQAGCMGLIVAVNTYKEVKSEGYDSPVPFPNYACFCIEREIHKMHKHQSEQIENVFAKNMIYLDEPKYLQNGDLVCHGDIIPDEMSEEELNNVLKENDLTDFFDTIVTSSVKEVAYKTQGQKTKFDQEKFIELEIRYLLEMAGVDSQKARFNLSQMARALGISVQNTRTRHNNVLNTIRKKCIQRGYKIEED